ncbi:hypothetical protein GCM10025774_27100 [Microbacterium kyungheense]
MRRREQLHVRADLAVLADRDGGDIERRQVRVDGRARADVDVPAEVDEQRRLEPDIVTEGSDELGEDPLGRAVVGDHGPLVLADESYGPEHGDADVGIVRDVEIAREHPLVVGAIIAGEVIRVDGVLLDTGADGGPSHIVTPP